VSLLSSGRSSLRKEVLWRGILKSSYDHLTFKVT
jgi:hypothetical protein